MMQSAAVLPTESPVKSLPEILGVPLQRKKFHSPSSFSPLWKRASLAAGFFCEGG